MINILFTITLFPISLWYIEDTGKYIRYVLVIDKNGLDFWPHRIIIACVFCLSLMQLGWFVNYWTGAYEMLFYKLVDISSPFY